MIRHIVLIKFKPEVTDERAVALFSQLSVIQKKLSGVVSITAGKSQSPENIERGYMHGFVIDFSDWAALDAYQQHPDHKAFGAELVAHAVGGIEGILVFDLAVHL
jgi:quinol monooxygenase YgiN